MNALAAASQSARSEDDAVVLKNHLSGRGLSLAFALSANVARNVFAISATYGSACECAISLGSSNASNEVPHRRLAALHLNPFTG